MARGVSSQSGPAPDPGALRRDRASDNGWVTLPSCREGESPEWPLEVPSQRERVLWEREWRRPQAVMWERNGQEAEVAMYVRAFTDAERHGASVASRTLVRQFQESLGLSVPGLARNRWRISAAESSGPSAQPRARSGLTVVPGGAG